MTKVQLRSVSVASNEGDRVITWFHPLSDSLIFFAFSDGMLDSVPDRDQVLGYLLLHSLWNSDGLVKRSPQHFKKKSPPPPSLNFNPAPQITQTSTAMWDHNYGYQAWKHAKKKKSKKSGQRRRRLDAQMRFFLQTDQQSRLSARTQRAHVVRAWKLTANVEQRKALSGLLMSTMMREDQQFGQNPAYVTWETRRRNLVPESLCPIEPYPLWPGVLVSLFSYAMLQLVLRVFRPCFAVDAYPQFVFRNQRSI